MNEDLFRLLEKDVITDIFLADEAHAVLKKIAEYADRLNETDSPYDQASGV